MKIKLTLNLAAVLAALMAATVIAFPAGAIADDSLPVLIKKIQRSIVLISTFGEDGSELAYGSGFFNGATAEVLTNYHVVQGAASAEVKLLNGDRYRVLGAVSEDRDNDVMRIATAVPEEYSVRLELSRRVPELGEKIFVIGNPMGLEQTVSDGIISAIRKDEENGNVIQMTAPISSGSSGSPVMDMRGEVIGVAVSAMVEGQNLNFAVPGDIVSRLSSGTAPVELSEWKKRNAAAGTTHFAEGMGYLWLENYKKAIECFEKAALLAPEDTMAVYFAGYCNHMAENYEDAITYYEKALALDGSDPMTWLVLGEAYYHDDRFDDAVKALKNSIRCSQTPLPEAIYDLGIIYVEMKDRDAALAEHKKLKKLDEKLAKELMGEIKGLK